MRAPPNAAATDLPMSATDLLPPASPSIQPPYYAVIFCSQRTGATPDDGYGAMAERMAALAATQPGYLGVESDSKGMDAPDTVFLPKPFTGRQLVSLVGSLYQPKSAAKA